ARYGVARFSRTVPRRPWSRNAATSTQGCCPARPSAGRFRRRTQTGLTTTGRLKMKLLIFGASGATGRALVSAALAEGHMVTAFVRTPGKLAISHQHLKVIVGDVADRQAVERAVAGHDAVLSCLG